MGEIEVDVLQIGAGQAVSVLQEATQKAGLSFLVAERHEVGGSCVNFGCTPTKAAIASARIAHLARRGNEFGIHISSVQPDFGQVIRQARAMAEGSRHRLEKSLGEAVLRGHARFEGKAGDRFWVQVGSATVLARNVVIDVGTRSALPDVAGLDKVPCLHAGNWLDEERLPKRLAILGGGYIAIEMGQFYARMGSEVTIIDRNPHPLGREDPDVVAVVQRALEAEGVRFLMDTSFDEVTETPNGWRMACGSEEVLADQIFVATGRKPNTDDLGLASVGITPQEDGTLKVNERLQTDVPGIYVVGDVRGGPQFTHTSWDDGRIVASALTGGNRTTDRVVPNAVYTDPQIGRVGLSESEAKRANRRHEVKTFSMSDNAAAQEDRATEGFIKVLVDGDQLLGATIVAEVAVEMIEIFAHVLRVGGDLRPLRDGLVTHPSYMEAVQSVLL